MVEGLIEVDLKEKISDLRVSILEMLYKAGSGHPGGSLSAIDVIAVLYYKIMNYRPKELDWVDRDRFLLSKSHCCPALYAVFADLGYFDASELNNLRQIGSILQGHPCMERTPGIEVSAGSLGQGLSIAVGMAVASKIDNKSNRIYCMIGDGESQEGQIWEAAMAAGFHKLNNLCCILDYNKMQIDGFVKDVMDIEPVKDKWLAFNWNVIEIDGHNLAEIEQAFIQASENIEKPTIIISHTIKGKGVAFMENSAAWHGVAPNKEQLEMAVAEIRGMEVSLCDILN